MGYKISDTPLSGALPNDALIEIETAAGAAQHIAGTTINDVVNNAQTEIDAATKYTIINSSVSFTPNKSDGAKVYYRVSNAITITIPTQAAGGYNIGDEITFFNVDGSTKTFDTTGLTINNAASFSVGFNESGSPLALVCVGATEWDLMGDMSV